MEKNEPTPEEIVKYVSASGSSTLSSIQPKTLAQFIALGCRFWQTLESEVAIPKEDRCSCHPLSDEIASRLSRLTRLAPSEVQECWGVLRPLIAQTAAKSDEQISLDYLIQRHSISIPPVSYCINKNCPYRKRPLFTSTIDTALLYTFRHGVRLVITEMLVCTNIYCVFNYYKDYTTVQVPEEGMVSSRTYYSSQMPEFLQVQEGVYVERDLCKLFRDTISPTCPGSAVAAIYNESIMRGEIYPSSEITEETVLDAVYLYSRLQDSQRNGEAIKNLPHPPVRMRDPRSGPREREI